MSRPSRAGWSGVPSVRPGEALGRELEEFYRACGGLSLFAASDYGVEIAGPESFSRANLEIVGREVPDDLTDSWYVLARAASGERLTIDCHPARVGRCHDSFWDSRGVRGSCPIIALSLAELLARLLAARGKHWYWLEDDWNGHGDAYAARSVEGEGLAMAEATTRTISFVRTTCEVRPMTEVPVWLGSLRDGSDRLAAVMELSRRFVAGSDTERRLLAAGWPFDANWPYPDPSRLGCQKGETYSSRDRVVASLMLDHLEGVFGSREHLIALSATVRSCELAGLDASAVLEDVARCLPHEDAESLRSFLRRPEAERRPADFGLVETVDVNGEVELSLRCDVRQAEHAADGRFTRLSS